MVVIPRAQIRERGHEFEAAGCNVPYFLIRSRSSGRNNCPAETHDHAENPHRSMEDAEWRSVSLQSPSSALHDIRSDPGRLERRNSSNVSDANIISAGLINARTAH